MDFGIGVFLYLCKFIILFLSQTQCIHFNAATKRTKREKKKTEAANPQALPPYTKKRKLAETLSLSDDEEERPQQSRDKAGGHLPAILEDAGEDEELDVRSEKVSMQKLFEQL